MQLSRNRMISEAEALESILSQVAPRRAATVSISQGIGRFAAGSYRATLPMPLFDNSAMDGYAITAADGGEGSRLRVIGEQPAGLNRKLKVKEGEAVRIFTGAPIPIGTAAVVMQEDVSREREFVGITAPVDPGEFSRRRGCDLAAGQEILTSGQKITPVLAALLASQGIAKLGAGEVARVGLISTGDEVVGPETERQEGQIFESNSTLLGGLVSATGAELVSATHCPDNQNVLTQAIAAGSKTDALIISGGVSVGERDFVQEALRSAGGEVKMWRVAIKPGKPFLFGKIGRCCVFGLPGNPVSAFVTFLKLVRPALLKMMGANERELEPRSAVAQVKEDLENLGDRAHYFRGRYENGTFSIMGRQESHALYGLSRCNSLLRVEANGRVAAASMMQIELWE